MLIAMQHRTGQLACKGVHGACFYPGFRALVGAGHVDSLASCGHGWVSVKAICACGMLVGWVECIGGHVVWWWDRV